MARNKKQEVNKMTQTIFNLTKKITYHALYVPTENESELIKQLKKYEQMRGYAGGDYLIIIKEEDSFTGNWQKTLEILSHYWGDEHNFEDDEYFEWLNDWYEGQPYKFIGFIDIYQLNEEIEDE